jgi:hypothetical protein
MPKGSLQPSRQTSLSLDEFLREMKSALAAEGLPFLVLRNYSGFPCVNAGNDIDLLLEPANLSRAVRALRSINGIQAIAFARRPYVANLFFHGVSAHPDSECPGSECIEIDFDLSLSWKGIPFLAVEEVLSNARLRVAGEVEFLIPSPQHEAIISLFLSLLVSGFVKEKYLPDVQAIFGSARQEVHFALAPRFGEAASRQVIDAVVAGDRDRIRACIRPLRRALFKCAFCRRPAQTAIALIRHHGRELLFRLSPALTTDISIASADESRRADLIAALAPMLKPATVLLETQSSPAGLLRRSVADWIRKVAPKKHLTIRLHANCCFDWLAKPKTAGNEKPVWRERLAARLSPAPHLLIVLSCSGRAGAESVTGKLRCVRLDSSRPITELAEEAYTAILALLAERAEQRIRHFA